MRHGQTEWNVERRIQGHFDSPLTKVGEQQAFALGRIFNSIHFDKIFSSDLLRAKRTAEIIMLEKKLEIVTTKMLRERNFGKLEGIPVAELKEFDAIYDKLSEEEKYVYKSDENIESDKEIMERFITYLREIAIGFSGKNILVVTHAGVMRALLIKLGVFSYKNMHWGAVKNTAYIHLESDGVDFFVKETSGITIRDNEAV